MTTGVRRVIDGTDKLNEEERCLSVVQCKRSRGKIPYTTENLRFTHRAISSLIIVHISE